MRICVVLAIAKWRWTPAQFELFRSQPFVMRAKGAPDKSKLQDARDAKNEGLGITKHETVNSD